MFVKLYGSILTSSIWEEDPSTRLVWITLLAMADKEGHVQSSIPGLARMANVSREDCDRAIDVLATPDTNSGSTDYEGRRIKVLDGGFHLLNYAKYREIRTREQLVSAETSRRYYEKQKAKKEAKESGK